MCSTQIVAIIVALAAVMIVVGPVMSVVASVLVCGGEETVQK